MSTVIDELIVILNLDPSKFTAAQKQALEAFRKTQEAAEKNAKNIEAAGKKIVDVFIGLKREALTLFAVFLGGRGLKEAISYIMRLDASTEQLSRQFDVSTHNLAIWQSVLQQVGGTAEDARSVIGGLTSAVATYHQTGVLDQGLLNVWQRLGLSVKDREDPIKVLKALASYSQTSGLSGPAFAAFANQVPGMTPAVINALDRGPEVLEKYIAAAEKAGVGSKKSGEEAEDFIQDLSLLETATLNVVRVMEDWLIPAMKSLTELFASWVITPGSPEAKGVEDKFNADLEKTKKKHNTANVANAFADWVDGLTGGPRPAGAPAAVGAPVISNPNRATKGNPFEGDITGGSITDEAGNVTYFGPVGAKGAAATNVNSTDRSSKTSNTTSSTVNIDTINLNLPRATDAGGIASGLHGAISNQAFGAPANSGAQ